MCLLFCSGIVTLISFCYLCFLYFIEFLWEDCSEFLVRRFLNLHFVLQSVIGALLVSFGDVVRLWFFVIPVVFCWYHAPERVGISSNLPIWLPQGKPSPIRLSRDSGDSGDSFVHICWSPHTVASWCLGPWHLALCLGSLEQVWHLSLWHGCRAWSVWVGLDPEPAGATRFWESLEWTWNLDLRSMVWCWGGLKAQVYRSQLVDWGWRCWPGTKVSLKPGSMEVCL